MTVVEVPHPDRRLRRQRGKSDPIDAQAAARTVLASNAGGAPKLATGAIEAIRMLRVARAGAVKGHTASNDKNLPDTTRGADGGRPPDARRHR